MIRESLPIPHEVLQMLSPTVLRSLAAGLATAAAIVAVPSTASAASSTLRNAVQNLPGGTENRTGYDRSLFRLWVDADGDGCDTRREVLIDEAVRAPTVGSGCSLTNGRWVSPYDNASWTDIADLDIDHLVPLAEAWDSGASSWSASRRQSYANDLGDPRSLIAVTDNVNQEKGDQDPAEWVPPLASYRCTYTADWVATKLRWSLKVDSAERSALARSAADCPDTTICWTVVNCPPGGRAPPRGPAAGRPVRGRGRPGPGAGPRAARRAPGGDRPPGRPPGT
jgi:hypothetical protein